MILINDFVKFCSIFHYIFCNYFKLLKNIYIHRSVIFYVKFLYNIHNIHKGILLEN